MSLESRSPEANAVPSISRILVATDFGEPAQRALAWAARHLVGTGELVLLHVIAPQSSAEATESERRAAESRLADVVAGLPHRSVIEEVRVGVPADEIVVAASQHDVDLVIVGEPADTARLPFLSSTVEHVMRHATVPVFLVRDPTTDRTPKTILAAVHDPSTTARLLSWTNRLAAQLAAAVLVVHVVPPSESIPIASSGLGVSPERAREELTAQRQRWIDDAVSGLTGFGRGLTTAVLFGDPAAEILAAAERADADVVVVGRGGLGSPLGRVLAGVAARLFRSGTSSLLLVTGPPRE